MSAIERTVALGDVSTLGISLYSAGIPNDSVHDYEAAVDRDEFLVMAHGDREDVARAKTVLAAASPVRLDAHSYDASAGANATFSV